MFICECGKEFGNSQSFNGHKANCRVHFIAKYGNDEYYNVRHNRSKESLKKATDIAADKKNQTRQTALERWLSEQHTCENCGKVMTEKYGSGRFCCRACSNARKHSEETKQKISNTLKQQSNQYSGQDRFIQLYENNPKFCEVCGARLSYEQRTNKTCSYECAYQLREANKKAAFSTSSITTIPDIITNEDFIKLFNQAASVRAFTRSLGYSVKTASIPDIVKRRCEQLNLNINDLKSLPFSIENILANKVSYKNAGKLKKKLIAEGYLEDKCAQCGIGPEWAGKPLTLELHHIDGNHKNNALENLEVLCPNCHSQTETFGSKNIRYQKKKLEQ